MGLKEILVGGGLLLAAGCTSIQSKPTVLYKGIMPHGSIDCKIVKLEPYAIRIQTNHPLPIEENGISVDCEGEKGGVVIFYIREFYRKGLELNNGDRLIITKGNIQYP